MQTEPGQHLQGTLLLLLLALFLLLSPLMMWWASPQGHWLNPFLLWLGLVVLAFVAQRRRDRS